LVIYHLFTISLDIRLGVLIMVNLPQVERHIMKRIAVRKPGIVRLAGTSSVIHKG
jgi:hypothetical protein